MAYCSSCGKAIEEGSKFCSGCGTTLSGAQAAAPITRVVVVKPRSGGLLAFKGFLTALLLAFIFVFATKNAFGMVIAFGIGAAYIIISLRKWKRSKNLVHGGVIAWTVAVFLLLVCFVGLMGAGITAISKSMMSAVRGTTETTGTTMPGIDSTSSGTPTPDVDPKNVLLRDVKLDFKWHTEGFGSVMIANFTIKNPTQYRFKDFEIKCTHSAPSGTVIDSNTRTIYQTVEPTSTKVVKDMSMGFINSQAARSGCQITDLVVIQ
jgi:hypothetical protein